MGDRPDQGTRNSGGITSTNGWPRPESWFAAGEWDANTDDTIDVPSGTPIVMSFDGSYNGDSTVILGATIPDGDGHPHVFVVDAWERPDNAPDDWRIDRDDVDRVVDDAFREWDVVEFAMDPARWSLYMNTWIDRYGEDRVIEYPQSRRRMVPATSKAYDAVTDGLVTHDGNPMMSRHIANATVKPISEGRYVLTKDHPDRKIDGAVAFVMAYDRATWRRDNETGTHPVRDPHIGGHR